VKDGQFINVNFMKYL